MKIPLSLRIGGFDYEVGLANLTNPSINNKMYAGLTSIFNHNIKIEAGLPKSQKEQTLFHEIIEAINGLNDLQLNHTQISTLSNCLYQVYVDNKKNMED